MDSVLNPLYIAVSFIMRAFHSLFSGLGLNAGLSWSLSIVGLVITIRIILIPLFVKQIKSQRALQVLQPKMKELQKKYKDDRQKQSEECSDSGQPCQRRSIFSRRGLRCSERSFLWSETLRVVYAPSSKFHINRDGQDRYGNFNYSYVGYYFHDPTPTHAEGYAGRIT